MLWLAIHFPDLPLAPWTRSRAYCAAMAAAPDAQAPAPRVAIDAPPLAIVERNRICRADAQARARGIVAGMSTATARALCEGLLLRERQPPEEQALLARLAQYALQFTPQVSVDGDDGLLLEIGGCLRIFHGLDALLQRIRSGFSAQGIDIQAALAGTPGAAHLFARHGIDTRPLFDDSGQADSDALRRQLAALPVDGPGLDPRTQESIMQMGLTRLGDLDALPRQALGRRFGQAFTLWLDRVTGAQPDPRAPVAPETFFVREVNFLDGISHADGLLFPMQRLLGEFGQFLRHRQLATQHMVWRLVHVDRSSQEIVINTSRPELAPARLLALTRVRLETTRLQAPVETLRLACRRFLPLATRDPAWHDTLFPELGQDAGRDEGIATLLDRLRARLGDAQCRQLAGVDGWRPETAQAFIAGAHPDAGAWQAPAALLPAHTARRPLWLLPEPARIERDGTLLRWRGPLELLDGPERIESDWWTQPVQRDYFVARHRGDNGDAALYWVFHDLAADTWHVHGVFG